MKRVDKPKMKKREVVSLQKPDIEVVLDCDMDRFQNGWMRMGITNVEVSDDNKNKVGSVSMSMTGDAVYANIGSRQWSISVKELWPIFKTADEQYTKENS